MEALPHRLELSQEEFVDRVSGVGIDAADHAHVAFARVAGLVAHVERWLQPSPENLLERHLTIVGLGLELREDLQSAVVHGSEPTLEDCGQ